MKIYFMDHWLIILVVSALISLIVLSVIGLRSMEPFYRHMTLANMPTQLLLGIFHAAIFVFLYMTVLRDGFSKFSKKSVKASHVNVTFDEVLGIDEAKEEAWEVVELIRDRQKVKKIGGKILKGLLMVGPPGCGKTLLAKAIATEANIPFISIAGSEFVEVFVGVGASRVRKLFAQARRQAEASGACIIFIDELDAIAQKRKLLSMGGGQETNATQNQLLIEMDGLGGKGENIIVIGATNAGEDTLDDALLRPGRFDRKVYIDRPGLEGREQLFRFYLDKVQHDPQIDIGRLARIAIGKSPAEIENIVKEAALIALREKKEVVDHKDLSSSFERIELGIKHKKSMTKKEREMTAYHEVGHLVTTFILHPTDDVFKASIIARKASLGVVYRQPREELYAHNKNKLLADIKVALAGFVAEKVKSTTTTTGVSSDFRQASSIANHMVWTLGMSDNTGTLGDYTVIPKEHLSEDLKKRLNKEVEKILTNCLKEVETLLKAEWEIVERFVKELLEKEELEYDEIENIFKEYGKTTLQSSEDSGAVTPW
jgi:cell division protease FtsH